MLTLLASLLFAPSTETGIKPVSVLARELSIQIGKPIQVEKSLQDVLLLVEPGSSTPKSLLQNVATALHGSVVSKNDGLSIVRTQADVARDNQAICTERSGWITHRLNLNSDHRLELMRQGSASEMIASDFSSAIQQRDALVSGRTRDVAAFNGAELLPETVLLESLLSKIGLSKLASLQGEDVAVYEDNPCAGELAVPEHTDLLDRYRTSVEQLDRREIPPQLLNNLQAAGKASHFNNWGLPIEPGKVRITEIASWVGMEFLIEIFDGNGHRLGGSGLYAGNTKGPLATSFMLRSAESQKGAKWVQVSGVGLQAQMPTADPKSGKLPLWYYCPTKTEPLNLFVGSVLRGMADDRPGQPTIIVANDAMWNLARQCTVGTRISTDAFERALIDEFGYEKTELNGCTMWRPRDPAFAMLCHADRKALERFSGALEADGEVSLRSLSELFSESNADGLSLASTWSSMARLGRGSGALSCDRSPMFLKMLGKIPDEEWDDLMASKPVTLGQSGIAADFADYLVKDFTVRTEGADVPDLFQHPAETLPNGPASGAIVKFNSHEVPVIQDGEMGTWIPQSVFETSRPSGVPLTSSFKDGQFTVTTARSDFESAVTQTYRFGSRDELTILFQLTGNLYVSARVHGNVEPTSADLTYQDLPADLRDRIWANTCQQLSERMARMRRKSQPQVDGSPGPTQSGGNP